MAAMRAMKVLKAAKKHMRKIARAFASVARKVRRQLSSEHRRKKAPSSKPSKCATCEQTYRDQPVFTVQEPDDLVPQGPYKMTRSYFENNMHKCKQAQGTKEQGVKDQNVATNVFPSEAPTSYLLLMDRPFNEEDEKFEAYILPEVRFRPETRTRGLRRVIAIRELE